MSELNYDRTGKLDLGQVYNRPAPVDYYATLSALEYRIPAESRPFFSRLVEAMRASRGNARLKIADVGCSYGIHAALLRYGKSMDELYRHYAQPGAGTQKLDRTFFANPSDTGLDVVGIDTATNAIRYALDAKLLSAGVTTNLENRNPGEADRRALAGTDLVVSTGCFGYVSETTLERILEASGGRPWMAHFVLRMFAFDEAREMLEDNGYVVEKLRGVYPQRRFASQEEHAHVLENLRRLGIEHREPEASGWYVSELFVARPREEFGDLSLENLFSGLIKPAGRN